MLPEVHRPGRGMMRQSQVAMRTLLRLQAVRQKIETDATAAGRAA